MATWAALPPAAEAARHIRRSKPDPRPSCPSSLVDVWRRLPPTRWSGWATAAAARVDEAIEDRDIA